MEGESLAAPSGRQGAGGPHPVRGQLAERGTEEEEGGIRGRAGRAGCCRRGRRRPDPYLHNASTSSPGGTCGAIPSRPLRRRSWCTPRGLEGQAPEGVGGDSGRAPGTGGHARTGGTRRLPRRGGRAPRALRRRPSLSSAAPRAEAEPEREPGVGKPELTGLLSVHPPGRQARRPAASAAVGLSWDSAGTRSPEL